MNRGVLQSILGSISAMPKATDDEAALLARADLTPDSGKWPLAGRLAHDRVRADLGAQHNGLGSRSHSHVLCGTLQFLTRGSEPMHIGATGGKRDDGSHTAESCTPQTSRGITLKTSPIASARGSASGNCIAMSTAENSSVAHPAAIIASSEPRTCSKAIDHSFRRSDPDALQ
jgi:hypothetical protein